MFVAVALTVSSHAMGLAQGRTDVVSLPNGDRITGEVVRLDRGILEFKTDEAGTIYLDWIKLATSGASSMARWMPGSAIRGRAPSRSSI